MAVDQDGAYEEVYLKEKGYQPGGCTERVRKLRNLVMGTDPVICVERALLVTEAYKENEALPMVLRRAKALEKVLNEKSINILDGELIVGNQGSSPRAAMIMPEFGIDWIEKELINKDPIGYDERPADRYVVPPKTIEAFKKIAPYWRGRTVYDRWISSMPEEAKRAQEIGAADCMWRWSSGEAHIVVDYAKAINCGLNSIINEAEQTLQHLELTDPEYHKKESFLQAVVVTNKAAIAFARRYAEKARSLAKKEKHFPRKKELEQIAEICEWVPANPARNFREAVQAYWFVHLVIQIEDNGWGFSLGRVDQILYPYYFRDQVQGRLARKEALELIECFWIKINEITRLRRWEDTNLFRGHNMFQNATIGGQTADGKDATNEVSLICLDATADVRLPMPALSVRYHKDIPEKFFLRALECVRLGGGLPAVFNDEVIIPSLMMLGIPKDEAYSYALVSCIQPQVPGKYNYRCAGAFYINMLKVLDLAIHGGRDPKTNLQLGPKAKSLGQFECYEELVAAWRKQVEYCVNVAVAMDTFGDIVSEEITPKPFASSFVSDCIRRGRMIEQGGAEYDHTAGQHVGFANMVNSLAAIKKVVFEDKALTGDQLLEAIDANFWRDDSDNQKRIEGEKIRQRLLRAPKYGNDDDSVDAIAVDEFRFFAELWRTHDTYFKGKGPKICKYSLNVQYVDLVSFGFKVGASCDGRVADAAVGDGGVGPYRGTDTKGATAAVLSVSKLPHVLCTGGNLINLKFPPADVAGVNGLTRLGQLLEVYFDRQGWEVQLNIVDAETLKAAQQHPEEYPTLNVRVAGYSALFTPLAKEVQDEIIARTEHRLV